MTLLARVLLLVLLAVAPATAFLAWNQVEQRRDRAAAARDEALREARALSARLDSIVENEQRLLLAIAEAPVVRGDDAAACNAYLTRLRAHDPGTLLLAVARPDGGIRCDTSGTAPDTFSVASRSYHKQVVETGRFATGEYAVGMVTKQRTLHFAVPVRDDAGQVTGVAMAGIGLDWLAAQLGAHLPPGVRVSVLDRNGVALLRAPDDVGNWVGRPLPAPLFGLIAAPSEAVWDGRGPAGLTGRRILARAPLAGAANGALFAYVSTDRTAAMAPMDAAAMRGAALVAAGLVLAVLAAVLGGRVSIRRPVARLLDVMERHQRGDRAARVGQRAGHGDRRSELGRLGAALDALLDALARREAELREANGALERRVAERTATLHRREAEFEAMYNDAPVPLYQLDADARLLLVSRRWLEFMGYRDRAEVLGRHITEFQTPDTARRLMTEVRPHLLRTGGADDVHYQVVKRSGEVADVLGSARIVYDADGQPLRTMSAIIDVTDRLRAEAQLRQAQKMEAVGQLTGGVAHDFNNLLTAVMGNLELICRAAPGHERVQRLAAAALKAAGRGARLTASLLAFSRRQALQTEALDANALLREFETLLRRAAGETVRLELRLDPALAFCQADAAQLEAAVLNLAINARDAMATGGTLVVATANADLNAAALRGNPDAQPGRFVAVSLRDSGTGMAPDVLARAFEPFFTTKEQGKGTGLGLSQVFGFVRQSGGHVAIRSAPGQGTTVTLFLPQAEAEAVAETGGADARPDGVVAVAAATVLLVEDDPDVREVTRATLRDAGLRVIAAHDAAEALRLLEAGEAIDLLFTDVVMPGGVGGVELARRTRALRPGVAILLASGYATAALRAHGVEPGEFAVLGKPYRLAELTARIRAALDRDPAAVTAWG